MAKQQITPLTKEEMTRLMDEIEKKDEFDFMLFSTLKLTGRRIGELFGIEERKIVARKIIGKRTVYISGRPVTVDKTAPVYQKTGRWVFGVQVKDIDFEKGTMKVWVLKRRNYIQDETVLTPELVRIIARYVRKNRLGLRDYVFRKNKRSLRQIQNIVGQYAKKAKINHIVVTHNFRHYFVTELRRKGWTQEDIKVLTGHKSASSLASYEHLVSDDLRDKAINDLKDL